MCLIDLSTVYVSKGIVRLGPPCVRTRPRVCDRGKRISYVRKRISRPGNSPTFPALRNALTRDPSLAASHNTYVRIYVMCTRARVRDGGNVFSSLRRRRRRRRAPAAACPAANERENNLYKCTRPRARELLALAYHGDSLQSAPPGFSHAFLPFIFRRDAFSPFRPTYARLRRAFLGFRV